MHPHRVRRQTQKQTPDSSTSAVSENDTVVTNVKERGLCFSIAQEYIDKGVILEAASENTKGYKNIGIFTTARLQPPS